MISPVETSNQDSRNEKQQLMIRLKIPSSLISSSGGVCGDGTISRANGNRTSRRDHLDVNALKMTSKSAKACNSGEMNSTGMVGEIKSGIFGVGMVNSGNLGGTGMSVRTGRPNSFSQIASGAGVANSLKMNYSGNKLGEGGEKPAFGVDDNNVFVSDEEDEGGGFHRSKRSMERKDTKTRRKQSIRHKRNDDDENMFAEDEMSHDTGHTAAGNIWKTVESYFADITEEDFQICQVKNGNEFDQCLVVSPLEDRKPNFAPSSSPSVVNNEMYKNSYETTLASSNQISLTSRLISALTEEVKFTSINQFLNGLRQQEDFLSICSKGNANTITSNAYNDCLNENSEELFLFLDELIPKHLMNLDLYGGNKEKEPSSPLPATKNPHTEVKEEANPEEDQILTEIKKLQNSLKLQIELNNKAKKKWGSELVKIAEQRRVEKEKHNELLKQEAAILHQLKLAKNKRKIIGKTI